MTLNLVVNQPTTGDTTAIICESDLPYTWYGHVLTSAGTAQTTMTSAAGCDSIVTLNLVVNKSEIVETNAVIYEGQKYKWSVNNFEYSTEGQYKEYGTTAEGCDLTYVLNLSFAKDTTVTVCYGSSYSLNGVDYGVGTYYIDVNGEGICSMKLVVNELPMVTPTHTTEVACKEFTWYGTTYTTSGDYIHTLTNVNGCDSVLILHLTINQPTTSDTTAIICESDLPYDWYGNVLTSAGTVQTTMTNAAGCDSIVTLNLIVNKPTTGEDRKSVV